jgi:ketosteroid isomerase-like protein
MGDGEAVIRDIWRRWNAGQRAYDPEIIDPEIVIHSALTGQVFDGEDGVTRWVSEIDEQFEAWELSIEELSESEPDRLVVRGTVRARGRQSGLDLDQAITWRVELRDGRLLRLENSLGWDDG